MAELDRGFPSESIENGFPEQVLESKSPLEGFQFSSYFYPKNPSYFNTKSNVTQVPKSVEQHQKPAPKPEAIRFPLDLLENHEQIALERLCDLAGTDIPILHFSERHIKEAHRRAVRLYHPDLAGQDHLDQFHLLQNLYEILWTALKRIKKLKSS